MMAYKLNKLQFYADLTVSVVDEMTKYGELTQGIALLLYRLPNEWPECVILLLMTDLFNCAIQSFVSIRRTC